MIRAITDNDLYKFSMANAVLRLFPNLKVGYRFTDRKGHGRWTRIRSARAEASRQIRCPVSP